MWALPKQIRNKNENTEDTGDTKKQRAAAAAICLHALYLLDTFHICELVKIAETSPPLIRRICPRFLTCAYKLEMEMKMGMEMEMGVFMPCLQLRVKAVNIWDSPLPRCKI